MPVCLIVAVHHCSVVRTLMALKFKFIKVRAPSTPSMLFSIYICHLHWNVKRTKINKKRPGLAYFFKKNFWRNWATFYSSIWSHFPDGSDSLHHILTARWYSRDSLAMYLQFREQRDQMATLLVQYLAIYNNENLPNSSISLPNAKLKLHNCQRLIKFCQSYKISP